jgi:hypothetical protein
MVLQSRHIEIEGIVSVYLLGRVDTGDLGLPRSESVRLGFVRVLG